MLAQNFKTPADLDITDVEFDALSKVLGMLEREELKWDRGLGGFRGHCGFNMRLVHSQEDDCGTVACILGWAQNFGGEKLFHFYGRKQALTDLFLCGVVSKETCDALGDRVTHQIRTDQAAIALRNYLTHGEPRWAEALAG